MKGYYWCRYCCTDKTPFGISYDGDCGYCGCKLEWHEERTGPLYNEQQKHERKLAKAYETGECPCCGAKFEDGITLYDHGWKYGIECTMCK